MNKRKTITDRQRLTVRIMLLMIFAASAAGLTTPVHAKTATLDEALTVANNWIDIIVGKKGGWGDANTAFVEDIKEFKRGPRTIGYFCNVEPVGYIIVSLRKELAPVKAYSAKSNLDPESGEGMADLIKGKMEGIIDVIEQQAGPVRSASTEEVSKLVEINYSDAWTELERDMSENKWPPLPNERDIGTADYREGDILLNTDWGQGDPYNQDCPAPPGGDDCTAPRCLVGCVATAGAQIMRYWYWPPYGIGSGYNDTYDWPNMPNSVTTGSPAAQRNAVAELSHEIGVAVGMDYCDGTGCQSSVNTYMMEFVYENTYRYQSSCVVRTRSAYSAVDWFNLMKNEFNANRPVHYRIKGHSIVGDGWQEIYIGSTFTRQYHMNYGWAGTADDIWYTLDALYQVGGGNTSDEYILDDICPVQALENSLSTGTYPVPLFPYRYFYRDTTGFATGFASGHYLQFLPGVKVTSTGVILFEGSGGSNTRLFTRGDTGKGIRIYNGAVKISANGSIKLN